MKSFSLALMLCFIVPVFSQVEELKKNSDQAREKLGHNAPGQGRTRLDFTRYVNPFVGTGGHGHTYPGAVAPFGMIQLSPDTRYNGWDGCSGYHYSDSLIYGFSHTHLSGTGVEDLCDMLIVPQQGKANWKARYQTPKGFAYRFNHADETALPGSYSVKLRDEKIDVRLAATERCGIHEYTFERPKGKKFILIDLDHRDKLLACDIDVIGKNVVTGHRRSHAWAKAQEFYFYLETAVPFTKAQLKGNKLLLTFPASCNKIVLKVGISAVDTEGAKKNLFAEINGFDVEAVINLTRENWNRELGKIHISSEDPEVMANFYTALYHSFICPSLFSDVDGRYRGNDNQIYQQLAYSRYTTFSIWDTYRATHPLFTLIQPLRDAEMINNFLDIYRETGELPVWELWGNETDCMIGYHAVSVINDAFQKGIKPADPALALKAMLATAGKDELGKMPYATQKFISSDQEPESVSKTLEYAYDDWNIARFARSIGETAIADSFERRSYAYLNLYHPQNKFMQPRRSGFWVPGFKPAEVNFNFTEANSWQYSLYVPQHLPGFTLLLGGPDSLELWLDRLFNTSSQLEGRNQADITGLIGQYAHGNEPSHHMAYLYNYTAHPEKTQVMADRIMREMYHPAPDGLSGNEDCGQMSSWYVLSALGFYPVSPGLPEYAIGRPMMNEAGLHLENGKSLYIHVLNNSKENKYIQEIKRNGMAYTRLYVTHEELMQGGEFTFVMGNTPNPALAQWQRTTAPGMTIPEDVVPVPYVSEGDEFFTDAVIVKLGTLLPERYYTTYTTDGSEPLPTGKRYVKPIGFNSTTTLKARNFYAPKNSNEQRIYSSATVTAVFRKIDPTVRLMLQSPYANQYAAGGPNALVDGLRGGDDFRSGAWQGYEGIDLNGELHFAEGKQLSEIRFSCLQDIKSWIFMPASIEISFSTDGTTFQTLKAKSFPQKADQFGQIKDVLGFELPSEKIRVIRFKVKNRKTCPPGHLGAGEKAWIFLDEIELK